METQLTKVFFHFLSLQGKLEYALGVKQRIGTLTSILNLSFRPRVLETPILLSNTEAGRKKIVLNQTLANQITCIKNLISLFFSRQGVPSERSVVVRNNRMNSVLGHYRSYGWVSATSAADAKKKAADIKFMRKAQQKAWMRLGTRANKLQKYWRDPTLQWSQREQKDSSEAVSKYFKDKNKEEYVFNTRDCTGTNVLSIQGCSSKDVLSRLGR